MKTSAFQRGLLLGAALLAGMPLSAAAKCALRGPNGRIVVGQPLVVIDGRQGSPSDALRLNSGGLLLGAGSVYGLIYATTMLCWNPADSTYNRTGVGVTVTQVVTRPFMKRLVADLEKVATAQRNSLAIRGTYSTDLKELGIRDDLPDGVSIELSAGPTGWSAIATKDLMVHRCVVRLGEVPPPAGQSSSDGAPTQPVRQLEEAACLVSIDSSQKHALNLEGWASVR